MATINKTILNREVKKLLFNKDIQDLAYQRASREFQRIKKQALAEFDNHPVTQEINGGIQAKNISNTLPGTKGDANLFSFIGFPEDSSPTQEVRNILEDEINLNRQPKSKTVSNGILFTFDVEAPTLKSIEQKTPLPWEVGLGELKEEFLALVIIYLAGLKHQSPVNLEEVFSLNIRLERVLLPLLNT